MLIEECNFILEEGRIIYPFEVKYGSKKVIGGSPYSFIEKFHPPVTVIFSKDFAGEEQIAETLLKFIPLSYY